MNGVNESKDPNVLDSAEMRMLINNKDTGFRYKERREQEVRENYDLYRGKVTINRLTQRQSVHLPIMKGQINSLLKDNDEMTEVEFENKDNDQDQEILVNELWKDTLKTNNSELFDISDKKQEFLTGRSFDDWKIDEGRIKFGLVNFEDMIVDRYCNPYDIDSARYVIHTHILKPISWLEKQESFDQDAVEKVKKYYSNLNGLVRNQDRYSTFERANQKLADIGVPDANAPILGETLVELSYHYVWHKEEDNEQYDNDPGESKAVEKQELEDEQIWVYVECANIQILMKKKQEELMGETKSIPHYWRNHYRFNSWAEDVDVNDFWTDGKADIIRTPNKIINSWFSQEVERRTLSNLGMHYYDASSTGDKPFLPDSFEPKPWGWIPLPGKPKDFMEKVDVPASPGNLDFNNYVIGLVEKGTGATAIQQGDITNAKRTLGEVQMADTEAKRLVRGISKFYNFVWEKRAERFLMLLESGGDSLDVVKLSKKGKNNDTIFSMEIDPSKLKFINGYRIKIWNQTQKKANDLESISKLQIAFNAMPNNSKMKEIYQKKLISYAGLTPDESKEVMDENKQLNLMPPVLPGQNGQSTPTPQPGNPIAGMGSGIMPS